MSAAHGSQDKAAVQREALRQQMLLRALWRDGSASAWQGWLRPVRHSASTDVAAGVAAYRGNAAAVAERALASAFPTVAALVGDESFAALARDFWRHHPPLRGDLGEWGAELPEFMASKPQLASEPYLSDSARLDWRVHQALRAADAPAPGVQALETLAHADPSQARLLLMPGAACVSSAWPVVAIWHAHHTNADAPDRFADVRAAFAEQRAQNALVWRDGYAVRVDTVAPQDRGFTAAVVAGQSLAQALDAAAADFSFERWLQRALTSRWLAGVQLLTTE